MLVEVLVVLTVAYCFLMLVFGIATLASRYPFDRSFRPRVSIVVAARNEEVHISRCLESLSELSYPRELLEIIIIDDGSTDRTASLVAPFLSANPNFRLLTAIPGTGNLSGKTNAVTQGIEVSGGEILMFTDADCRVPSDWVEETVKYYAQESVGVVGGFTFLRGTSWFSQMQALDWFVLFSAAAATTRLGYPTTAVGTNLSVRRQAYDSTGGYRTIPFSVTEDYALFHAIATGGRYRAGFPRDRDTLVESEPCASWKILHRQKKRWFSGGRGMDAKSLAVFAVPYFVNVALLATMLISPAPVVWCCLSAKFLADLIICLPALLTFGRTRLLRVYPLYWLYYLGYVLLYPPLVMLSNRVLWKERSFS